MAQINPLKLLNLLKESNIELIFSGTFSQGLIEELGDALKERLKKQNIEKSKISCTFMAFVEQTQNIKNYIISKENSQAYDRIVDTGIVAIAVTEEGYSISSGNMICNEDIEPLKLRLDKLRSLDKEGKNKFFKEMSKLAINIETGQAGLGLIQIARKVEKPVEYSFERIDDEFSFYNLKIMV